MDNVVDLFVIYHHDFYYMVQQLYYQYNFKKLQFLIHFCPLIWSCLQSRISYQNEIEQPGKNLWIGGLLLNYRSCLRMLICFGIGLDRTEHMSFLTGQVLLDRTKSGLIFLNILYTKYKLLKFFGFFFYF